MSTNITEIEAQSLPEWVTETPEHYGRLYSLTTYSEGGDADQAVEDLTREEFIWLKARLAERRGLVRAEPDLNKLAECATEQRIVAFATEIQDDINSQVRLAIQFKQQNPEAIASLLAELGLLREIVQDWGGGSFNQNYPGELHLVGAIRGNLGL